METGAGQEHCPGGCSEANPGDSPGQQKWRDGVVDWWSDGVMECGLGDCGVGEWGCDTRIVQILFLQENNDYDYDYDYD